MKLRKPVILGRVAKKRIRAIDKNIGYKHFKYMTEH